MEEELFYNKYQKEKLIGRGAFSEVWRVTDTLTGVTQALKIYSPAAKMDDDGVEMMIHEFALMANVNHQNLLHPLYFDICDSRPFLVLPFCKNGNINSKVGKFTEREGWKLLYNTASALEYLHSMTPPVIHQDIKPDNILIGDDGSYMLTDFGVSTKARSTITPLSKDEMERQSAGTFPYMPPEKFSSNNLPIMASDIWSLGATTYEMLTGYLPFGNEGGLLQKMGADIPDLQGDFSEELKKAIKDCLAKDPWDRPKAKALEQRAYDIFNKETVKMDGGKMGQPTVILHYPEPEPVPDPVPDPMPDPISGPEPTPEPEPIPDPIPDPTPDPLPTPPRPFPWTLVGSIAVAAVVIVVGLWWLWPRSTKEEPLPEPVVADTTHVEPIEPIEPIEPAISYGDWTGDTVGGRLNGGPGILTLKESHQFVCKRGDVITPQAGESLTSALFRNDTLITAKLVTIDGKVVKIDSVMNKKEKPENNESNNSTKRKEPHTKSLPYGKWTGSMVNGNPEGYGKLMVTKTQTLKLRDFKRPTIQVHAGDSLVCTFHEGFIDNGDWYKSNGTKETIFNQ